MENIFHHLLDHFILFSDLSLLILKLCSQLLVFHLHLIQGLFEGDFLLVEPFFICVFQTVGDIGLEV